MPVRERRGWLVTSAAFATLALLGAGAAALGAVQQQLGWAGAAVAALGSGAAMIAGVLANRVAWVQPIETAQARSTDRTVETSGLLFVRDGRLPLVPEVSARQLGVKIAVNSGGGGDLPPYVRRDVDEELVAAAADGELVLVHGPAAAGKSRTAYELVRRFPTRTLFVPDPDRRDVFAWLIEHGERPRDAVIWLDDIDRYLVPGGLDRTVLEWLCPAGERSVLVIGTVRDQAWSAQHSVIQQFGTGVLTAARASVGLDRSLTQAEQHRAQAVRADRRVMAALRTPGVGFGEYLAAGPQLMDRWGRAAGTTDASVVGYAIVAAAVDFRRAGYSWPVPTSALERTYQHYLPLNLRWHPDLASYQDGLRWAREVAYDTSACLLSFSGHRYLAHDYLLDQTQAGVGPIGAVPVAIEAWSVLSETADPDGLYQVGVAAYLTGRMSEAETAFRRTAEATCAATRYAMFAIGVLSQERHDVDQAERWWRRAAELGHAGAMLCLSVVCAAQGDGGQSAAWYQRAAQATTVHLAYNLDALPEDPRLTAIADADGPVDHAGTASWWLRMEGAAVAAALQAIGDTLNSRGDTANAEHWWRSAATAAHVPAMRALAVAARNRGDLAEAARWFTALVENTAEDALNKRVLADVCMEMQDMAGAERWYETAAELGDHDAMRGLVDVLVRRGRLAAAAAWCLWALEAGAAPDTRSLLVVLQAKPDTVAEPGVRSAVVAIGTRLARSTRSDDRSGPWFQLAADAGDHRAECNLAVVLSAGGSRLEEAERLLLRAAESNHPTALYNLAQLHLAMRNDDAAERWYVAAAEAGSIEAALRLARRRGARDPNAGFGWLDRARLAGAKQSEIRTIAAEVHQRAGNTAAAMVAYRAAANDGEPRAEAGLGVMLLEAGHTDEALHLLHAAEFSYDTEARAVANEQLRRVCTEHDHEDRDVRQYESHTLGLELIV
jgi:TPR repeat protein